MRTRLMILTGAMLLAASVSHAAVDKSIYDPKKISTPPIGRIAPVTPERFTLGNGMVVFLLENHDLPVVTGTAYVRTSPTFVADDRVGLGGLTGEVMRSGGTAKRSGDYLDDRLAAIGAAINTNIGADLASSGFRSLTDNLSEVLELWSGVIRTPAFPDDKIELAKVGLRRQIASRNDELLGILTRVAPQAVFGKGSPWARQPEYATVEPISADDCKALHAKVFVPERMVLAVYGDFKRADMKKMLTARFGDWKRSGTPAPVLPPTPAKVESKLVFAPKEDVTQSGIVVAQPSIRVDDPDYAALQVLEQGLGGGFASRMFSHIRTQRGLAYGTGASAGADYQKPGVFIAYSLTKSESTMVALDLVREEVRKVTEAPFTAEEMDVAKSAVVNAFVFNFEDPSQTLFRAAQYEAMGYPQDFLARYQKALESLTAADVLAAAKRKITPSNQVVILVGKESDFDRPLASVGLPLERVDVTIPPPASRTGKVAATPEARATARGWLEKAVSAAGGRAAWAAIKSADVTTDATVSMQGQSISLSIQEISQFPDKQLSIQKLPFGEMKSGFDGKSGWAAGMGQLRDDPKAAEGMAKDWERSLWRLFSDPAIELVAVPEKETIDGVAYDVAVVSGAKSQDLVLLFDPQGRLAGMASMDDNPQMGPARMVQLLSDWKPVGAVQYPHAVKMLRGGELFMDGKVSAILLNPTIAADTFAKPAQ